MEEFGRDVKNGRGQDITPLPAVELGEAGKNKIGTLVLKAWY